MKKVMALFAALILLLGCLPAQAEGFIVRFDETWINAYFLGEKCAWVLDRDGNLMRWSYDESEPAQIAVLPVPTREMFENYSKTYSELPAANRAQIEDTVTILAEDGELLYALNQYSGKLGIVTEGGLHWNGIFDASAFCLDNGEFAGQYGALVMNHRLYLLLNCFEQRTNFVLEIDLSNGETRELPASEAYRMAAYNGQLLLACGDEGGASSLKTLEVSTGQMNDLNMTSPASEGLAHDASTDTIYMANDNGIYTSRNGEAFQLKMKLPTDYMWGEGSVTQSGQYVYICSGIWVMTAGGSSADATSNTLRLQTLSGDPVLRNAFAASHPQVLLDWQTVDDLTAADIADAIRGGDYSTDIFSVKVDGAFKSLVEKGFVSPMTNQDILGSVARMYPELAECLKDSQGRVIAYPWDVYVQGTWEVNEPLWEKYFGSAAYPTTWQEFFTLMLEFEDMENDDGDLFLMTWDYEWMMNQVLTSFIVNQDHKEADVDFSDSALHDTLNTLAQVRIRLLDRGYETYDEAEIFWESEIVGDHSIFQPGMSYSSHSAYMGQKKALPAFTFSDDDPIFQGGMRVMIVNPYSERKEMAEEFIALLSQIEYSPIHWYLLHADAAVPYDEKPYSISAEDIAGWQSTISMASFPLHSVLLTDAFDEQEKALITRYAAGQMDLATMLRKLNETAWMIESEMN